MSFIQQFFTSRDNNANAETFVGQEGRLWWDPVTNQIYSSDGSTPGGIPLAGGGGGNGTPGGSNSQVQFNNSGTFGGSANLTFNRVSGALTAVSFSGDGSALSNIAGANVVGEVTNATYASSAVNAVNAETVTANSQPNINSLGILTELSVTGNVTGNYFIGNGSQLTGISSGASNTIFNGNSNVDIATPNGNVTITANTSQPYTWTFDTTGELLLAGDVVSSSNLIIKTDNDNSWISQAVGVDGFSQLYWTSNISAANPYNGNDDFAWAYVDSGGFFVTSRTVEPAKEYNWDFRGSDGALITPGKFITPVGNTSAIFDFHVDGAGGGSDLEFGTGDAPGSQYFLASVQDPLGRSAEFQLNAVDEGNLNAQIRTSDGLGTTMQWDFTANGDLILPGDTAYIGSDASRVSIYSDIDTESAGITVVSGSSTNIFNEGVVNIETNSVDVLRQWQFDQTGNLTIPGSIILPTPGSIISSGYNNPELLTANADSNWAYGFSSDNVANYYTQVKFYGDNSATRGFKILDVNSANVWLFDGQGSLTAPGNIVTTANVSGAYILGNGSALTSITGTNVSGTVANATYAATANASTYAFNLNGGTAGALVAQNGAGATGFITIAAANTILVSNGSSPAWTSPGSVAVGTVTANAQPNITSVGTLTSVTVTGNVTGGNLLTGGLISATSSVNSLNLVTRNGDANPVNSRTQIAMGFNGTTDYPQFVHTRHNAGSILYNTIELWTSDGTQAGTFPANAVLGLTVMAGRVSVGNSIINPGNTLDVGGNVYATGTITSAGNIAGGNLIGTHVGNLTGTTASLSGNITGGNILSNGQLSAAGNITGGNISIGGNFSTPGNIGASWVNGAYYTGTWGTNFLAIGNVSATGNVISTGAVYSNYNTNTANTGSFMATGGNTKGGTGYLDFLVVQNTSGGATVPYKWLRTTSDGQFQIINSAYTQNIFNLTDAGNVAIPGQIFINGAQTTNGPAFSAYAAAILQTIPNDTQTKVLFQTEEYDTNNCYANSRFTPNVAGYYQLNAEVRLDGASGTGEMMIILYKNGAEYKRGTNQRGTQIAANFWAMQVSSVAYANGTGDYFEIYVQQGSGGSVTVTAVNNTAITWFNGCMLRGA